MIKNQIRFRMDGIALHKIVIVLEFIKCTVCNTQYDDVTIGNKHVYGTCPKCKNRVEIGNVF